MAQVLQLVIAVCVAAVLYLIAVALGLPAVVCLIVALLGLWAGWHTRLPSGPRA